MRICFQAVLVSIAAAGAARTARVPSDVPVLLTAVVRHHAGRLAELDRRFTEVSTPGHPDHGRFLTQTEALALLDPGADRLDAVIGWLTDALGTTTLRGLSVSPTSDVLRLETTVLGAEALGMVCSPRRHFEYKIPNGPASRPPPPEGITPVGCSLSPTALQDAGMVDHIHHVEAAGSVRKSRLRRRAVRQADSLPLGCTGPSHLPPPPCPGPLPNPAPYDTAVFPPGPVVPMSLTYGGAMFQSAINPSSPNSTISIMPRCFGNASTPRVLVPISNETANNAAYWTNKTTNPCNDGLPITMYTVTVTTQSGTTHSSSIHADSVTPSCIHYNQSVCEIDSDGISAKLYPSAVCKVPVFFLPGSPNLTTNEGYSINITLEIGSRYNVTEQVSTFVPATRPDIVFASVPGYELPAPVYVTQEKLADDMRDWYDIPSTTKVSLAARPQAYGILQNPTIGASSYRPEDLSTAYMLNGISQDLLSQAHFLEVPAVVPIAVGPILDSLLTDMEDIVNATGNATSFLPAPCTINNSWVACNCGTTYGTVVTTGTETSLDVQMMAVSTQGGHTYGIHSGYWSTNGPGGIVSPTDYGLPTTWILMVSDIVMAILLGSVMPWTLSFSYGLPIGCTAYIASLSASLSSFSGPMNDLEELFRGEIAMIEVMDAYFQALGAVGVSVLASSGDQGSHSGGCLVVPFLAQAATNAGCSIGGNPSYIAVYPAASPFVTAVGGTGLAARPNGTVGGPACRNFGNHSTNGCVTEQVISIATQGGITSGGGFARQVTQPQWQQDPIASYLTKVNLTETAGYPVPDNDSTALGAGFPDLAAFAGNIMMVAGGIVMAEGGTSAASPFTAGMVSLLNSELQKQGAGPLGFLNPMLYGAPPSVFNDIVDGSNNCRGQTPYTVVCCEHGYQAAEGWDPASGLGSLNFTAMLDYALSTLYSNATPPDSLLPWTPASTAPTTAAIHYCPVTSYPNSVNINASGVCPDAFVGVGSGVNTETHQPTVVDATVSGPTTEAPVMPPTSRPSGGAGPLHLLNSDLEKLSAGEEVGIGIGVFVLILLCCVVGCYCYTERGSKRKGSANVYDDSEHHVHLLVG